MDHSDQHLPQAINSVFRVKFEDTAEKNFVSNYQRVYKGKVTMSARMYGVYDYDGSVTKTGKPSILGSNFAWWDVSASLPGSQKCIKKTEWEGIFVCPWLEGMIQAYIKPTVPVLNMQKEICNGRPCQCTRVKCGNQVW